MIGIIYNTAGISGRENDQHYFTCIDNILKQSYKDYKLVISSCCNSQKTIDSLLNRYVQKISINWIKDVIPVNCSFNHSVKQLIKNNDKCDAYLYLDSGIDFENQTNILEELLSLYKSGPYSMVSIRTDTNTGFSDWLQIGSHDDDSVAFNKYFRNLKEHYIVPIGKTINLHATLFSHELLDNYNNIIPDIWASECSESVFSFLNAAINKKWVIHKDLEIKHSTGVDIPSAGFSPVKWTQTTGRRPFDHAFIIDSILPRIRGGLKFGLGYEEITQIAMHDATKFDSDGYALCLELKDYIKNNLFLQKGEFDYNKINSSWL